MLFRRSPGSLRPLLVIAAALVAPLALSLGAANAAGEFRTRLVGTSGLRPSWVAAASASAGHAYSLREFDPLVKKDFNVITADAEHDLTVGIYGPGDAAFGQGAVIRLAGARGVPGTVVVPKGTAVFFRNDDPFTHHIIGPDVDRDLKPGESHKVQPKDKGVFAYTDTLFPAFKAWIVVDDGVIANRAPALDGSVKIALEPNEYTFKIFFEGKEKAAINNFKVDAKGSSDAKDTAVSPVAPSASASGK